MRLPKSPLKAAARVLFKQLLLRFQPRNQPYWQEMVRDLLDLQDDHEAEIAETLVELHSIVGGLTYEPLDLFDRIDQYIDDPSAVIVLNPPILGGDYEKFFDTGGRLEWAEPEYRLYDPDEHPKTLLAQAEGRAALFIMFERRKVGQESWPDPVYARHSDTGLYWYGHTNRPDELLSITNGRVVQPRKMLTIEPLPYPMIPRDYEITDESTIEIVPTDSKQSQYYKDLWQHRIRTPTGLANFAILIDGHVAGCAGYGFNHILIVRRDPDAGYEPGVFLRYYLGAPHDSYRLARLSLKLMMQDEVMRVIMSPAEQLYASSVRSCLTSNFTQYQEMKQLRGLMKKESVEPHKDGYKLHYRAPIGDLSLADTFAWWIKKEAEWRVARKSNS